MAKRNIIFFLLFFFIALTFVLFSIYFFWQGGPRIRNLNKNLPEGIKVEKRGNYEVIVNKIDSYEIKVPKEWKGLKEIDFTANSLGIAGEDNWVTISIYNTRENLDIEYWINARVKEPKKFNLVRPKKIGYEEIGNYKVIKIKDFGGVLGDLFFYYFKRNEKVYEIYSNSEDSIKNIILNGNF